MTLLIESSQSFFLILNLVLQAMLICSGNSYDQSGDRSSLNDDFLDMGSYSKKLFRNTLSRPSLFHVVKFPNDECHDLSNQSGTCYTPLQCKAFGGTGTATCAKGYGTCCIISRTCHNTTAQKVIYFKNPSYPQMDNSQNFCDLTIEIRDPDVCQLRVDFLDFQMDQPIDGNCLGDRLKVSATGLNPSAIPTLCGTNRNQHLYVHLPPSRKERTANLLFETNNNGPYRWHVRITQIDCVRNTYNARNTVAGRQKTYGYPYNDHGMRKRRHAHETESYENQDVNDQSIHLSKDSKLSENNHTESGIIKKRSKRFILMTEAALRVTPPAPQGCLQFYNGRTGVIESFNFGHYFNNLDYAICVESQANVCKMIFQAGEFDFGVESSQQPGGVMQVVTGAAGDVQCAEDYVMIPGGSQDGEHPTVDRFCGSKLQPAHLFGAGPQSSFNLQPVISKANGPIVLRFHTDDQLRSPLRLGFRIRFEQSSANC